MDKLDKMWEMQDRLNQRYGFNWKQMAKENSHKRGVWIMNYIIACWSELTEIMNELHWKHWKPATYRFSIKDEARLREEIIDLWHFAICLAHAAGLSSEELFALYCEKNQFNHNRQDNAKTPDDKSQDGYNLAGPVRRTELQPSAGPACRVCGGITKQTGRCYTCTECGETGGCG